MSPLDRRIPVRGIEIAAREWEGDGRPFVLVHGLASNAHTWDGVAPRLNAAGHRVIAIDQRGHGRSDKPDTGYGFDEVTADLAGLIEALELDKPVVAGQSWGGNVVLDFAARYPGLLHGLVLVDGGFIELSSGSDATWERISVDLKPPPLAGTPRPDMLARMRNFHPDWSEAQIEMQMGNFETQSDDTIRPWLTLDRHMQILRALWEQHPSDIYPSVSTPTMIAVAESGPADRLVRKRVEVEKAENGLANARVRWFADTAHDIHVHRPDMLADWLLEAVSDGFFESKGVARAQA